MSIFRKLWSALTHLKNTVGNLLFLFLLILISIAIFSGKSISIPDSVVMIIDPPGVIVDQKHAIDPFAEFMQGEEKEEDETLLKDVLDAIQEGKKDRRVKALVLSLDKFKGSSLNKLQEIGSAITDFKSSGKKVLAFGPGYSQSQFYLAMHADEVYINKQSFDSFAGVFLTGFGVYPTYFKSALDKLKVQVHVFKAGTYKGAVEPFMRNDMSPEAREDASQWLNILWAHYKDTVVERRNISKEIFDRYTNSYDSMLLEAGNNPAELALSAGLVDGLIDRSTWVEKLNQLTGTTGKEYAGVGFEEYLLATRSPIPIVNPSADKIAVIVAKGNISDGEQPKGAIGGDSIRRLIKKARDDSSVKAIVVRVDSPGGSASASEMIRSELELAQNQGKPVVISMSGYAASGGYWIASTANKIFAAQTTITGSIGVFGLVPTFAESFASIGVYSDGVGTTALSNALNPLLKINSVLENTITQQISHTYKKFLALVARGRNMSEQEVDQIAQGRVWAGVSAVELGLVDALGNLEDAIDSAALLAGVSSYDVLYLEKEESTKEKLMREILKSSLQVATWLKIDSVLGNSISASQLITSPVLEKAAHMSEDFSSLVEMSKQSKIYVQCFVCRKYD